MNVVAGVEKPASRDRDVADRMSVEGKLERQLHRHCTSMRLRKKFVDGEVCAGRVDAFSVESRGLFVLHDCAVVVFMIILVNRRDVVVQQSSVRLLIVYVDFVPFEVRAVFTAFGGVRGTT